MRIFRSAIIILFCLFVSTTLSAQSVLTGIVTDETGETVIGASVYVENKENRSLVGTVTGLDGDYRLQVPRGDDLSVVFSMIGYKVQKIRYTGQATLNVKLVDDTYVLTGVEITTKAVERSETGLTEREFVAATQKIEMTMLETAPVSSIEDALQGRLAGVDIITSAEPGASSTIRIRGQSSLNGAVDPLIVIDGVPYPTSINEDFEFATATTEDFGALLNIPPNDIDQIEVLKDAAATSVWGSKGANGVLLITTKKGYSGKTSFTFDAKYSFGHESNTIPMLSSSQYVAMIQDAIWNTVQDLGASSSSSKTYLSYLYDTQEIGFDPTWTYFKEYNQQTDWLDEIKQTLQKYEANFSMRGGGEKAIYRLSLGYYNEEGTTRGTAMERLNASFNLTYKFSNKLNISTNFLFSNTDKDANWMGDTRSNALKRMPNMSPYYMNEDNQRTDQYFTPMSYFQGSVSFDGSDVKGVYNPVAMARESKNQSTQTDSRFTFNLNYKILPTLTYDGIVNLTMAKNKNKRYMPQTVTGVPWTHTWFNVSGDYTSDKTYITTRNRLVYVGYLGPDHKLTAYGVMETEDTKNSSYASEISGNASPNTSDPTAGGNVRKMASGTSQSRTVGFNVNVHYAYKDRYMVNLGYRHEGNSSLSKDNRWGGFSTVGLAWVPSEEEFIKSLKWITFMKLRASWGQSGNTPTGSYAYIGKFSAISNGYIDMNAVNPSSIQLSKLKWETLTQRNLGIDASFLNDRLAITGDIYKSKTTDLLHKDATLPSSSGYSKIAYINSGSLSNQGWEFRIDYEFFRNKDWVASFNFNMSEEKNKLLKLPENMTDYMYSPQNGYYAYNIRKGDPLGSFYGYKYKGVYQNVEETYARDVSGELIRDINGEPVRMVNIDQTVYPGDAKYEDINSDGVINEYDIVYLGNSNPKFSGGAGFDIRYKDFMFSAFFHARLGQKVINQTRINTENMRGRDNQSTAVLKRWRHEGDNTDIPRALFDRGYNYLGSDRFVEDASFLRLKNVTLRYDVPKEIIRKWGMSRLYVYCTAYDLFTWTDYTGQDPEVKMAKDGNYTASIYKVAKDNSYTPKARTFLFGIGLNY